MITAPDLEADHLTRRGRRRTHTRRALTIGAAIGAAGLIWTAADPIGGTALRVGKGDSAQTIGLTAVVLASLITGIVAAGLATVLPRLTAHPRRAWTAPATVMLALSIAAGPTQAATVGIGLTLAAMHAAVGAILILGIGSTLPRDGSRKR